jgi:hypothetical protein
MIPQEFQACGGVGTEVKVLELSTTIRDQCLSVFICFNIAECL